MPQQRRPVDVGDGLFVAGDHRDTPSTQGALVSGRLVGGALVTGMLVDALTANAMPDHDRSALLGVISILVVGISAPFQYLCGWLADLPGLGPRLPMLTIVALFAVSMVLLSGSGLGKTKAEE